MFVEHTTVSFTQGRQMLILPETSYCTRLNIACVQMQENRKILFGRYPHGFQRAKARSHWWPSDSVGHRLLFQNKRGRKQAQACMVHKVCSDCDTGRHPAQYYLFTLSLDVYWYCSPISYIPVDLCCNSFAILLHCVCYALVYLYYLLAAL
jgi:hypothetical protein